MILKNFVVFEGIDGSGTSTQIELLKKRKESERFFFTAEPTSLPTGKFLRSILKGEFELSPITTAYLFAADRAEHLYSKNPQNLGIKALCQNGKIVISDRYVFSSLAYQSVSTGEDLPKLLNSTFPLPELLFFFKIDPKISLQRVDSRGQREIYEKIDFLEKTEECYQNLVDEYTKKEPKMKIITLDATKSKDKVEKDIWNSLSTLL
ncbi:dTMP kinase [Treponema pectinovorum]|uniref:dTMP kinase n=1 Tax=Treponema pectinovorum TaxID=164 RepID=UPI0011F25BF8|nr:dTMP kinase [Treponema pectinovorum]